MTAAVAAKAASAPVSPAAIALEAASRVWACA